MAEREERDWSNVVSGQIAVYKTDKALLELMDNLKPASYLFPAHIHARRVRSWGKVLNPS